MKDKDFKNLLKAVKEMQAIRKGTLKPARVFKFDPIEVDKIRVAYYKKHPKKLANYLNTALEEYQKDFNDKAFLSALSFAKRVRGDLSKFSTNVLRLSTLRETLNTLGLSLTIR